MVHRHIKTPSTSLATREMQIKTTLRYHLTPSRMAIINKSTNNKCWGCIEKGTLVPCWWECRLVQPLWKILWYFFKKLKMELHFDPPNLLMGIYPKNPESSIQKNLCTQMFIAVLFIIAKCWQQCKWVDQKIEVYLNNRILHSRNSYLLQQHGWNWRILC